MSGCTRTPKTSEFGSPPCTEPTLRSERERVVLRVSSREQRWHESRPSLPALAHSCATLSMLFCTMVAGAGCSPSTDPRARADTGFAVLGGVAAGRSASDGTSYLITGVTETEYGHDYGHAIVIA